MEAAHWPSLTRSCMIFMQVLLLFGTVVPPFVGGHVALKYPPARRFDLDFLDNVRTPPPCGGMPKGDVRTTLLAGSVVAVTWHMAYPHQGGYRLELLDSREKVIHNLIPVLSSGEFLANDTTAQEHLTKLPDTSCQDCTIRFIRQAREWGSRYQFWSCADVDIVSKSQYSEDCGGHGTYDGRICSCQPRFHGEKCQYENDCESDESCGLHGKCISIRSTSYPKKQCFCIDGYFGRNCEKEGKVRSGVDTSSQEYSKTNVNDEVTLHWRILEDEGEIEMVVEMVGTSYVALGWRSPTTDGTCQGFPTLIESLSEPSPESEPEPQPESEPESEPEAEPESSVTTTQGESYHGETRGRRGRPLLKLRTRHQRSTQQQAKSAKSLHAMDCTDIVIGMVRGDCYKIGDFYTRDRSTPRPDEFWGGSDSITGAVGWEREGKTTIVFRKKLAADDPSDQSITDGLTHVIWAKGQESGNYIHRPRSGLENGNPQVPDFYRDDELKYHGQGEQRGTLTLNFYENQRDKRSQSPESSSCGSEWKYPSSCSAEGGDCEYLASWNYEEGKDEISFRVSSSHPTSWTGIGFSDSARMTDTDVIYGWIGSDGLSHIFDGWLFDYASPKLDSKQSIYDQNVTLENGAVTLAFKRKRSTEDATQDVAFSDDRCYYFMYPVGGGPVIESAMSIGKHSRTPVVSSSRICIRSCAASG